MSDLASSLFRKRIKELRKKRRWTQEQAAEACGIDYKLYQFYELGIKANPGLQTLEKISKGFGLPLHKFLSPLGRHSERIASLGARSRQK